jgi:hypothetical protein
MKRQTAEKKIVGKLVDTFLERGYLLTVESDGYTDLKLSDNKKKIMDALFAVDEVHLFVGDKATGKHIGWAFLVFGNDGYDVICDHSTAEPVYGIIESLKDFIDDIEDKVYKAQNRS